MLVNARLIVCIQRKPQQTVAPPPQEKHATKSELWERDAFYIENMVLVRHLDHHGKVMYDVASWWSDSPMFQGSEAQSHVSASRPLRG